MKKIILLLPVLIICWSCQTDLDIPFPVHVPKLTLNGYLTEGGPIFLYVTRSYGALEKIDLRSDSSVLVRDAEVKVSINGEEKGSLTFLSSGIDTLVAETPFGNDTLFVLTEGNVYLLEDTSIVLQPGDEVAFRVSHPVYGEASVSEEVMPKPEILGLELVRDSLTISDFDGYQTNWSVFKIRVNDPGQVANYYRFKGDLFLAEEFVDEQGQIITEEFNFPITISTAITRDTDGFIFGSDAPLSDADFNGQETTILGWVSLPGCCGYPGDVNRYNPDLLRINLEAFLIDEDFGVFEEKRVLQSSSRTEGIEGAILPREPVSVVGNVEGGYGMLGSFSFTSFLYEF